ncbi:hypothetical protein RUND412_010792 [Rhizina undulata]
MAPRYPDISGIVVGGEIPGSYIVTLKSHASSSDTGIHYGSEAYEYLFDIAGFKGYSGTFSKEFIDEIAKQPVVESIEPNIVIGLPDNETFGQFTEDGAYDEDIASDWPKEEYDTNSVEVEDTDYNYSAFGIQRPIPSWGLAAISHRSGEGDSYVFNSSAGEGVVVFVLDSGIRVTHQEFQGRATMGVNKVHGSSNTDVHGHGTHVAGIVAVLNISLGWRTPTPAIDMVINAAFRCGYMCYCAAGNTNSPAINVSPARATHAFTVGATQSDHRRASYSNIGTALDIFAPGTNIVSCGVQNDQQLVSDLGTSQACPHVAGVAALIMSQFGKLPPQEIQNYIKRIATENFLLANDLGVGSPNLFLYNGSGM